MNIILQILKGVIVIIGLSYLIYLIFIKWPNYLFDKSWDNIIKNIRENKK
jgi:hypothetical protein